MNNADTVTEGLIIAANSINTLIMMGVVASVVVVISRIFGKAEFDLKGVKVPLGYFPVFLAGLTLGHAYLSWLFYRKCLLIVSIGTDEKANAWISLINKGGLMFSEMEKRELIQDIGPFSQSAYVMSHNDPAAWLSLSFAVAVTTAVIMTLWTQAWQSRDRYRNMCLVLLGASSLSLVNWIIGSQWAIAASSLAP